MSNESAQLSRRIGLPLLVFYGIGTILGAGIYVLVGKVAGYAGMQTPLAFVVAALLAGLTAFSYAELATRFPKSAGEAIYIEAAFHRPKLSLLIGLLIVLMAITSIATLLNGLTGYFNELIPTPGWLVVLLGISILGAIVIWGIAESVWLASIMTLVEIAGLFIIIWVARDGWALSAEVWPELLQLNESVIWAGILSGAFIAFYAFIGFEDMVNIAEEVVEPERVMPTAIIIALVVTTALYFVVALLAILAVNPQMLSHSDAPLAMIYRLKTGEAPYVITLISLVSITNGVLIQLIMSSRILYGLSRQHWLPAQLSRVNPVTHTPISAILLVCLLALVFALWLPVVSLAQLTSLITLSVFTLINLALWTIKRRAVLHNGFCVPRWVPLCGWVLTLSFLIYQLRLLLLA